MGRLATICLLLIIFGITDVAAQSSTTNAQGCHNKRKTGGYRGHDGSSSSTKSSSSSSSQSSSASSPPRSFLSGSIRLMSFSDYLIVETYDIKLTQTWLKTLGYFKGKPDGKLDQKTVKAIKRYQKDNGFKVDGKLYRDLLIFIKADARGPFATRVAIQ